MDDLFWTIPNASKYTKFFLQSLLFRHGFKCLRISNAFIIKILHYFDKQTQIITSLNFVPSDADFVKFAKSSYTFYGP